MTKSRIILISAALLLISAVNLLSQENKRTLRWAADAEGNAPYIIPDPRVPTNQIGFEVDIANAIAEELQQQAVFVQNQWDGLIPGLFRNDYDIAMNGIEITDDRKKEVNFSIPYYVTYEQLVVLRHENEINSLADLVGRKAGALKNSLAERILIAKGGINVLSYEGELSAFEDMKNGRIDAVLVDYPISLYYASWNKEYKLVGQPIGEISYGIAIKKSDTVLLNYINIAIEKITKNGKLREILEQWNLWTYMMEVYTKDHSLSNIPHKKFKQFLESQRSTNDFSILMNRYISFLPSLGNAALVTVGLSIVAMLLAILWGLVVALTRVYAPPFISKLAVWYIEIVRGTPLLIQLFLIFYALPGIGIKLSPFIAAVIGLGLNYAAYEAENYRAGLFSVPRGQMEAAISLGMTRMQAIRHIILPQAVRLVIPPVTNDFISLLKDSSLVSVITMVELTKVYNQIAYTYYDFLGPGIIVAIIYLLLGLPFVRLARWAEAKFTVDKRKDVTHHLMV